MRLYRGFFPGYTRCDTEYHDIQHVHKGFGDVPTAGFFCNGEIGPVGGQPFLHGFTASIALFRPAG